MFLRTESFQQFIRLYPIVTLLVGVHFILWLWINLALPGGIYLFENMVGYNMFVEHGEWWRLLTPIFLHVSFGHVLFNSFSLVLFGPALEKLLGRFKFIIAYVGAGFLANVATFYLEPSNFQHLGASGAIYGLFGIYLYMVVFRKELIDAANAQLIMTILVVGIVMTFLGGNINIVGHLFGFIGGALLAPLVLPKRRGNYTYTYNPSRPTINFKNLLPRRFDRNSIVWVILIILIIIGIFSR